MVTTPYRAAMDSGGAVGAEESVSQRVAVGVEGEYAAARRGHACLGLVAAHKHPGLHHVDHAADGDDGREIGGGIAGQSPQRLVLSGSAVPAQIQAAQTIDAAHKVGGAPVVIGRVAGGVGPGGRTGCGHQGGVQGGKEVRAGQFHPVHLEVGHGFAGVGRVEVFQNQGGAVVEVEDEVVLHAFHEDVGR